MKKSLIQEYNGDVIRERLVPFPKKKYNIILADPAWSYDDKAAAGNRGANFKYPVMSIEDICNLPVAEIADDNCLLFLWVTMPKLNEVFEVIDRWGFTYKTAAFTWIKRNRNFEDNFTKLLQKLAAGKVTTAEVIEAITSKYFWGMGRWTRANPELCLLAAKGKPKRLSAGIHSVIDFPIAEHSKKPDVVRDKIVELCGDLPRIELFARQAAEGWDYWGNEIGVTDESD